VIAEGEGDDEGFEDAGFGLAGEGFADLFDAWVFGVDGGFGELVERDAEADGGVFEVEVDHLEVLFAGAREVVGDALEKELVFAEAHGGDVGEAIVFVDEVGVGVGGVEAAGEDVEEGDAVTGGEPVGDGEGEGEGCVVAVGGEDEDVQGAASCAGLIAFEQSQS
jgi:hypothetical protein